MALQQSARSAGKNPFIEQLVRAVSGTKGRQKIPPLHQLQLKQLMESAISAFVFEGNSVSICSALKNGVQDAQRRVEREEHGQVFRNYSPLSSSPEPQETGAAPQGSQADTPPKSSPHNAPSKRPASDLAPSDPHLPHVPKKAKQTDPDKTPETTKATSKAKAPAQSPTQLQRIAARLLKMTFEEEQRTRRKSKCNAKSNDYVAMRPLLRNKIPFLKDSDTKVDCLADLLFGRIELKDLPRRLDRYKDEADFQLA